MLLGQQGLDAHAEGHGGGTGDGEQGADGEVQGAGEEIAVPPAHLAAHVEHSLTSGNAHGGDAQQGQTHAGEAEAHDGGPQVGAGLLAHVDGEDEVARSEEQAEEHGGKKDVFFGTEFTVHDRVTFLFVISMS